jgi:hypothetical protein
MEPSAPYGSLPVLTSIVAAVGLELKGAGYGWRRVSGISPLASVPPVGGKDGGSSHRKRPAWLETANSSLGIGMNASETEPGLPECLFYEGP